MQTLKKSLIILILLSGFMVSCNPAEQYKKEIAEIDSCLAKVDSLEILYDGIEFDSLRLMVEHVKANEKDIKNLYQPDTLNEKFGRQMNDCKAIRKRLKNLDREELVLGDEINAVKHQLTDLKEDVLKGVLDEEQIAQFLAVEKKALEKVNLAFMSFYKVQAEEKNRYYVVVPEVDAFIAELKTNREVTE